MLKITDNTTLGDLGVLLRTNGFGLEIEFGSGGYCVTITDVAAMTKFIDYSHDLVGAIRNAFAKALAEQVIPNREEKTDPGTPMGKHNISISELRELITSGKKFTL